MIRLLLLLIAIVSGITSVWMFVMRPDPTPVVVGAPRGAEVTSGTSRATEGVTPVAQQEVLVAAKPLPARHILSEGDLNWMVFEGEDLPGDSFTRSENPSADSEVLGRLSVNQLDRGELVRPSRIQEIRMENLSSIIEPGKRAISILVSEDVMAGGFILPGDRVDIYHVRQQDDQTTHSRILAQNVRVIALDQNTSDMIEGTSYVGRTATLEIAAADVASVSAAQSTGQLVLALRAITDEGESPTGSLPRGVPEPRTVRIIRQGEVETLLVQP